MKAAEDLKSGWLVDEHGKRLRHDETLAGVCGLDCKVGDEIILVTELEAVMLALQIDCGDRA